MAAKKKGLGKAKLNGRLFTKGNPHRWKKGQSGNPGGRPSKMATLVSQAVATILRSEAGKGNSYAEVIADGIVTRCVKTVQKKGALSGSEVNLLTYMIDRVEGRPTQTLQLPELAKLLDGRSDEEKEFFAEHGYWPDGMEQGQPSTGGSTGAGQAPSPKK